MQNKFLCGPETTVRTKAGLLRGYYFDAVFQFHGVQYAQAQRFHSPTPPTPWEGVREAYGYGYTSPMLRQDEPGSGEIRVPHRYWPMDEHCQFLNLWTPGLEEDKKRPVMVWLHGGGFAAGSSIEQIAYDGRSLAKFGDVVVITLNHRLNILGYLDLSPYGKEYANSANAGTEDIVCALRWVRDNIARFGGDPENVTVFGQSGGGEKVRMLMQCPAADGLFHKGIIQSGIVGGKRPALRLSNDARWDSRPIVEALMSALGVDSAQALETVSYHDLAEAYNRVSPALAAAGEYIGGNPMPNDWYLGDALQIGFTASGSKVPLLIGSVLDEFRGFRPTPNAALEDDPHSVLARHFGAGSVDEIITEFEKAFPGKPLRDLLDMDDVFRDPDIQFIQARTACQAATYSYMLTFDFDVNGPCGPWHCSEIPFVFHNAAVTPYANIEGGEQLEARMAGAWVSFARSGDPSHPLLPAWPPCAPDDEACMIFDRTCEIRHNHDHRLIELYESCENAAVIKNPMARGKIEH